MYPSFSLGSESENGRSLSAEPVDHVPRINSSGRDLQNALHTRSQGPAAAWQALLADLQAVFPWCRHLKFPAGPGRGRINLTWTDERSGALLYLDDMSEGMRVYMALLCALPATDSPTLVAFDEPERSLHPKALRRFVKSMESLAEKTPVIVETHSDRLLDYLEAPAEVVRITRFSSDKGVELEKLDSELLEAWFGHR